MSRSLRTALLLVGFAGLLPWGCTAIHKFDEGDRPPIIISDGSIDLMLAGDPAAIGEWAMSTSDKEWTHNFAGKNPISHFIVSVFNGKGTEPGCTDPAIPFDADSLKIESANPNQSVTLSIVGGNAFAKFDLTAGWHHKAKFWLRQKGAPMKMVTFTKAGADKSCEFQMGGGPDPEPSVLHILQKK